MRIYKIAKRYANRHVAMQDQAKQLCDKIKEAQTILSPKIQNDLQELISYCSSGELVKDVYDRRYNHIHGKIGPIENKLFYEYSKPHERYRSGQMTFPESALISDLYYICYALRVHSNQQVAFEGNIFYPHF